METLLAVKEGGARGELDQLCRLSLYANTWVFISEVLLADLGINPVLQISKIRDCTASVGNLFQWFPNKLFVLYNRLTFLEIQLTLTSVICSQVYTFFLGT